MKFVKPFIILAACFLLNGCVGGLVPANRTESAAVHSSEKVAAEHETTIKKVIEGERQPPPPQPNVKVDGRNNLVSMTFESPKPPTNSYRETLDLADGSQMKAGSEGESKTFMKKQIPLWVALIGTAVGLGLMILVWKWAKRSSPTFAAASDMVEGFAASSIRGVDEIFRGVISDIKEDAMHETDPVVIAKYQKHIGNLEAARGRSKVHLMENKPPLLRPK